MSRSQLPTFRQVRALYLLLGECRELGRSSAAWQRHMYEGLLRLTGAQVATGGGARLEGEVLRPLAEGSVDLGWAGPNDRKGFLHYMSSEVFRREDRLLTLVRQWRPGQMVLTRCREQLLERNQWHASENFNDYRRPSGLDDHLISVARLGDGRGGMIHGFTLHRTLRDAPFEPRHRRLVHLCHREARRLIGTALTPPGPDPLAELPPRLRQVLDGLLAGESEKRIAYRLGLTAASVHQYVKAVYRRFGVQSRGELMARFITVPPMQGAHRAAAPGATPAERDGRGDRREATGPGGA